MLQTQPLNFEKKIAMLCPLSLSFSGVKVVFPHFGPVKLFTVMIITSCLELSRYQSDVVMTTKDKRRERNFFKGVPLLAEITFK